MSQSPFFELICAAVEGAGRLSRPQARGVVRLAAKQAGLEPEVIGKQETQVLADRILPPMLGRQGLEVADVAAVCERIKRDAATVEWKPARAGPAAMFARLSEADDKTG